MRRVLAVFASVVLVVSCQDSNALRSTVRDIALRPLNSHTPGTAGLTRVFGADTFFRQKGKPSAETRAISTKGFKAPFILTIQNGDSAGDHRVSSGTVTVDGNDLLVPSDFNQQFAGIETEVPAGDTVHLAVQLQSQPGSYLVITLEAERAATRFCPADVGDGSSFGTFPAAIAATDTGGTIEICDGIWDATNVGVNKSLTFIPENPGGATVRGLSSAGFIVNAGTAGGTVRFAGLHFIAVGSAGNLRSTGVNDTLVVDSSTFRGASLSVAISTFTVSATASLVVRNNKFALYTQAVGTAAGTVSILDNSVDTVTSSGITTSSSRTGTIARNRVFRCGVSLCASINAAAGASGIEVVDNDFRTEWASATSTGLQIAGNVVSHRNQIIGIGGGGPPGLSASYAFRSTGVAVIGTTGHPTLDDNAIENAFIGVRFGFTTTGADGSDNRIRTTSTALTLQSGTSVTFQRNDLTGFLNATSASGSFAGTSLHCNYWGRAIGAGNSVVGPQNVNPFSLVPIANQPSVVCNPAGPSTPVPFCPPLASTGNGYATINDAVLATPDRGTIEVCDGAWTVGFTMLSRPMTIRAQHAGLATLTPSSSQMFLITTTTPGAIKITDLRFVWASGQPVVVGGGPPIDTVIVESNTFAPSSAFVPAGVLVNASVASGARTFVRNNQFIGGGTGVQSNNSTAAMEITQNIFDGQGSAIIFSPNAGPYLVQNNTFRNCGTSCVSASSQTLGLEVSDNLFEAASGSSNQWGVITNSPAIVQRNQFIGTGTPSDVNDLSTYAFHVGAIWTAVTPSGVGMVVANGNTMTNVGRAFGVGLSMQVTDNAVNGVHTAVFVASPNPFDMHRNDFTNYVASISTNGVLNVPPPGSMACNWWGSAAGPSAVHPFVSSTAYTPFSVVPIANLPGVVCP